MEQRFELLEAAVAAAGVQSGERLEARITELRERRDRSTKSDTASVRSSTEAARTPEELPRGRLVAYVGDFETVDTLKAWAKEVRSELGPGVIAAGTATPSPQLFVTVEGTPGVDAAELVRGAVSMVGGRGGGRAEMAQGKVPAVGDLERAIQALRERLQR